MDFNVDKWIRNKKFIAQSKSQTVKTKTKFAKASLYSIIFGSLVGIIIVYASGYDGFGYFFNMFATGFQTESVADGVSPLMNLTLIYFAAYALMGLGVALGFKVGLFNMGGSGQAVLGMGLTYLTLTTIAKDAGTTVDQLDKSYVIIILLMFILSGVVISTLAGVLKTTLNIHEVVTTVMLNWVAWYLVKWFVGADVLAANNGNTPILGYDWLSAGGNNYIIGVVVAIASIIGVWLVLTFTTVGYKFKVVGTQPDAAKYSGMRNNAYFILTTAVQGLFIGLGAMFFYMQREGGVILMGTDTIPTLGFDVIAVALVAFNNVLGILTIAFLWAVLKVGSTFGVFGDYTGISKETAALVFGAIVYGAAIYSLFIRINVWKSIKEFVYRHKDYKTKQFVMENKYHIKELKVAKKNVDKFESVNEKHNKLIQYKNSHSNGQSKDKLDLLKQEYKQAKQAKIDLINGQIKTLKNENKLAWQNGYKNYTEMGLLGMKNDHKFLNNVETYTLLNELIHIVIKRDQKIDFYKEEAKTLIENGQDSHLVKSDLKNKIKIINKVVNKESELLVKELDKTISGYDADFEKRFKKAKTEVHKIKREKAEKLNSAENRQEQLKIKANLFEKEMEVARTYG